MRRRASRLEHCLSFADAIEDEIEERSLSDASPSAMRRRPAEMISHDRVAAARHKDAPT
jgi:hypothetical protein